MAKDNSIMEESKKIGFTVIIFSLIWLLWGATPVKAAEEENIAACKQELLEMMRNMDSSWHDIAAWKLTVDEVNNAWWELIEEEGYVDYNSYNLIYVTYKISKGYALSMSIVGLDNLYPQRYASIQMHINIVKEATKNMTDLEKVLFVNEYIDDITYYYDSDVSFGRACGPLYYGYGVCADYTEGARMLLRQIGIPVAYTSSSAINHAWNYVNIDGEWYHMDCTWDDAKGQGGTDTKHTYFIRNDNEYTSTLPKKHYNWIVDGMKEATSTSTIYENWFVHDIKGKMHYYDGLWYYIDNKTGNIVCSKVDVEQSQYEVLVDKTTNGISKLAISKVEGNTLYYTADGVACELTLNKRGNSSSGELEGLNWSDASYWRTGHYDLKAGVYQSYPGRICLMDYVNVSPGNSYQAQISDNEYRILIRELDENKNYITGWNLCNGRVFSTSTNTKYLAVSIYSETKTPTYQEYCNLFEQGMTVKLTDAQPIDVKGMNEWSNEQYWRTGCYLLHTGKYGIYHSRICLLDYVPIEAGTEYKVKLTNDKYHMLIREMTQDMNYITSHDLQNGDIVKLTEDAAYAAISLYCPNDNYYMDYTKYLSELKDGMEIGISKIDKEEESGYKDSLLWNQTMDWRTGHYSMTTGIYQASYKSRVCLQDYVPIDKDKAYQVLLTDDNYHMLIREMTSDKSFIMSHNLAGGDYFIPSDNTAYLAISLYMPNNDSNAVFDDYVSVIQAGVGLQEADAAEAASTLALEDEEIIWEETEEEITEEETTEEDNTEESMEAETEENSTEESTEAGTEENSTEESTEAGTEENSTEESTEAETEENSTEESQEEETESKSTEECRQGADEEEIE